MTCPTLARRLPHASGDRVARLIANTIDAMRHATALLLLAVGASGVHAADDGVTERLTLPAGSYVVDTGSPSPTVANALKPYGLVYELVRQQRVPVWWVIEPAKAKDGADFTDPASGKAYRAGPFAISASYLTPPVVAVIERWRALGVVVDGPTAAAIPGVPVYQPITGLANTALDLKNGGIAASFFNAAGIPSSAFASKTPDSLSPCDDLFALPHADPTWGTHRQLLDHVRSRGYLWAGCHAVSVLENIDDPSTPATTPDMNFLSTDGLVPFGSHDDGSPPYTSAQPAHPVMQFIGHTDDAQQGGSEQIYLPKGAGRWRPGAELLVTDPSHADVPAPSGGPAAALVVGRAFDNPLNGRVMYEGGHNVGGSSPAAIAAQRAFLNFWLLSQLDRSPSVKAGTAVSISALAEGDSVQFDTTLNHFSGVSYQWTSSGGGVFSAPNGASTRFTAPDVGADTTIMIRVTVTDGCGRVAYDAWPLTVRNTAKADLAIAHTPERPAVAVGEAFRTTLAVGNLGTDTATGVVVEDVLPAGVGFVGAEGSGWTCAYDAATRTLRCTRPSLPLTGASPSLIAVDLTAPATPGSVSAEATVSAATPDANPTNNRAAASVRLVDGIDVALDKVAPAAPVHAGRPFDYTLTVRNDGAIAATSLTVDDVLPPALSYVRAAGSGWDCVYRDADRRVSCFAASLAPGASASIALTVLPAGAAGSRIDNTARVSSPDFRDTVPANDSASASVTLTAPADLALAASSSTTGGGSQIDTHVVTLTNRGPGTALGVVVDNVMGGAGLAKYAAGCTVTSSAGVLEPASPWSDATLAAGGRWRLASLASGASETLTLTCAGDNNDGVTNTASVSAGSHDPDISNDRAASFVVDGSSKLVDLQLSKTASAASALVGDTLRYTLAVTNLSTTDDAKNEITIVDTLPPGTSFVSAADGVGSWRCGAVGTVVTCTTGSDAKKVGGSPNTLSVDLWVRMPDEAGTVTNTASVAMPMPNDSFDPVANNVASAAVTVRWRSTDIAVSQTASPATPGLGGEVVLDVTAGNVGTEAASNLRLRDLLPAGLTLISSEPSQGSHDPATGIWYVGALATDASARLRLRAIAAQPGAWANEACVHALDQTDVNPGNDCAAVTVVPQLADLRLTKTVDAELHGVGTDATFTLTLTNLGGSAASAIVVADTLPDGLRLVSTTASAGSHDPVSGRWSLPGPLASGASATLTVVAEVTIAATPLAAPAVIVASSVPDPVLSNNAASATVTGEAADIEVTKTVDNDTPLALGTPLTFTVRASNRGPTGARRVDVSDRLPTGLAYVSHTADHGGYDPASGLWAIGALADGATATLRVVATTTRVGLITNIATQVAADPPDPGSTNDAAAVQILSGGAAALSVTKSVDKPATFQGDSVTFTVQLENAGPNRATGVVVQDLLPPGLTYQGHAASQGSYTPGSGLWTVDTLEVGQRVTLTLRAAVEASGALVNTARVAALDQADADPSDDSASATVAAAPAADLAVTLSVPGSAAIGAPVTLTLVGSNRGPSAVSGASLVATVPVAIAVGGWTCVASGDADCDTGASGSDASGSGNALSLTRVRIGAGPGDQVRVVFSGSAASAGSVTTTAILSPPTSGNVFDPVPANNSASAVTVVSQSRLSGRVFLDTGTGGGSANNGRQDGSEPGLAGVGVALTDCGGTLHTRTTTDGDGSFTLGIPSTLAPGSSVCVVQTNLAGHLSSGASAGNTGGQYDRPSDTLRLTLAADTAYSGVAFGDVPYSQLTADNARSALPGSTVTHAHTFVAGSAGQVSFQLLAAASPAVAGWTQHLWRDMDCDGADSPADTLLDAPLGVTAGETVCLRVRQFVPAGLPAGATNAVTLQAFFVHLGAAPALTSTATRQDLTTVSPVALQLAKQVRNLTLAGAWGTSNAARPGDLLEYRLTYTNLGVEAIQALVLHDMTPAYTTFVAGDCPPTLPAGLGACRLDAPPVGTAGAVRWRFDGQLASALSGMVSYRVRVD